MASGGKVIIKIDGDESGFKNAMGKAQDVAKKAVRGIAVGVGAASAAIGALGAKAVGAYADYEQLVGGVETLFKDSASVVQSYADEAYKSAGLSANQYMETITGFSASLLQSLGGDTAKAAEYGNRAVIDMSDNANKMGTSMELIQNAYQGFAKQNYTMLDNLKLGYGGTKEEMARLINDAAKMKDVQNELNVTVEAGSLDFGNIVNAISVMQQSMDIAGTTAREASTTIQGALGMVKGSWENLMTGLSDPSADIDDLMDNVISSVETLGSNLLPPIEAVMDKLPEMLETLGGKIIQKIPSVVNTILPRVADAAGSLIDAFADTLNSNAGTIGETASKIAVKFAETVVKNVPTLINAGAKMIAALVTGADKEMPRLTAVAKTIGVTFAAIKISGVVQNVVSGMARMTAAANAYKAAVVASSAAQMRGISIEKLLASTMKVSEIIWAALTGKMSLATAATTLQTMAQTALNAAMNSNPIGLVITAVAALAAGMYFGCQAYSNYIAKNSELVQATRASLEASEQMLEKTNELSEAMNNVCVDGQSRIVDIEAEAAVNKRLTDELYTLAGQADITAEAKERMRAIVDQLNGSIDGLNLKLDDETGKLNMSKDAVDELIEKKLEMARANAVMDIYTEQLKEQYKAQANAQEAAQKLAEAQEKLNDIEKGRSGEKEATKNLTKEIENYQKAIRESHDAVNNSITGMKNLASVVGVELPASFANSKSEVLTFFIAIDDAIADCKANSESGGTEAGNNFVAGYQNALIAGRGLIYKTAYDMVRYGPMKGTADAQDSHSPSKEAAKLGNYFTQGYALGIEAETSLVKKSAEKLVEEALDTLGDNRTEVQKVTDEMNEELLASEKKYEVESERLKKSKKESDKKYLESLKEAAEKERKIYDALQKDIEKSQKSVISSIKELAKEALATIEDVEKAQSDMSKKLKDYGELYRTDKYTINGVSHSVVELADISKQNDALKEYANLLKQIRERQNVPYEFFEVLRDMSIDEGASFAKALLDADPDEFNTYMHSWLERQTASDEISKTLYQKEAENAEAEIGAALQSFGAELKSRGVDNAQAWGEGFIDKITQIMPGIIDTINSALSGIVSGGSSGDGSGYSANAAQQMIFSPHYVVQASEGESTQKQIWGLRSWDFLTRMRGFK